MSTVYTKNQNSVKTFCITAHTNAWRFVYFDSIFLELLYNLI